jgi:hypothetical protein
MSRREEAAIARTSADLGDLADQHGAVDMLRAIGMVGQRFRVALEVWRLVDQGDKRALRPAFDGLLAKCASLGIVSDPIHVVSSVLQFYLDPLCKTCGGLCFERIPGSTELSARECPGCHGTGRRPSEWGEHEMRLDDWITNEQGRAAAAISAKLRED